MKKSIRLALITGACFLGLAFAAPAFSSYDPSLTIEQSNYKVGAATTVDVFVHVARKDDATAKLTIFTPVGYGSNLTAAPKTKIGNVTAVVKANALAGSPLTLSGSVLVADPTDPTIQAAAAQCTPGVTNDTIWVLQASFQGQTLTIPVFVKKTGALVTQSVCFQPPQTAPVGAQLVAADFTITHVFTNPTTKGGYDWATDFTPYSLSGSPNPSGTLEFQSYVGLPSSLTLTRVKTKKGLKLAGRLSLTGLSFVGGDPILLWLYGGKRALPAPNATQLGTGKRIGRAKRGVTKVGKYSLTRSLPAAGTFLQTRFEGYNTTACVPSPTGLPIPCKGESLAPVTSNQIRILKPKTKKHR
jgi:hypothetical protein